MERMTPLEQNPKKTLPPVVYGDPYSGVGADALPVRQQEDRDAEAGGTFGEVMAPCSFRLFAARRFVSLGARAHPPAVSTWNWSKASVVVRVPVTTVRTPTEPATWSPTAELVALACHEPGSDVPASQARARIVVGLAPVACTRSTNVSPALKLRPVSTSANRFACALVCPRMKTLPPEVT